MLVLSVVLSEVFTTQDGSMPGSIPLQIEALVRIFPPDIIRYQLEKKGECYTLSPCNWASIVSQNGVAPVALCGISSIHGKNSNHVGYILMGLHAKWVSHKLKTLVESGDHGPLSWTYTHKWGPAVLACLGLTLGLSLGSRLHANTTGEGLIFSCTHSLQPCIWAFNCVQLL